MNQKHEKYRKRGERLWVYYLVKVILANEINSIF
jgi:hypothetical protein